MTVYSILTGLFAMSWLLFEAVIDVVLPERLFGNQWIGTLAATVVAAGMLSGLKQWVAGGVTRRFFPESLGFDRAIEEVSKDMGAAHAGTAPGAYLGERLAAALGAAPCVVLLRLRENLFRKVWSTGETAPVALLAGAASAALETQGSTIIMTEEGPVLAARIGKADSSAGLLLLGPRAGGRFYTTEERRLLRPLLNQAALLLKASNP